MPSSGKLIRKKGVKAGELHYASWKTDTAVSSRGGESSIRLRKSKRKLVVLKAEYLTERLGGVSHFAEAVQADKSRVSRWAKGSIPDERNSCAIIDLEFVYQRLSRFLDDDTADKWLDSSNAFLHGQRPLDVLHQGRLVDVLSAANQEEAGSFA